MATALAIAACQLGGYETSSPHAALSPVVTGIVIAAEGPDAAQVTTFRLRDSDGYVFDFTVGRLDVSNGGLPAPHLREHLVSGDPISVTYRVEDGRYVAERYVDAE